MADNTLIIGNGACAVQTADHLIQHGLEVILASEQNDVCSAYPDLLNRIETGASEILKKQPVDSLQRPIRCIPRRSGAKWKTVSAPCGRHCHCCRK